jgi:hypothetical protein
MSDSWRIHVRNIHQVDDGCEVLAAVSIQVGSFIFNGAELVQHEYDERPWVRFPRVGGQLAVVLPKRLHYAVDDAALKAWRR